MIEYME